ncbi:MAG: oxygen-independent coproporphyrinogen III oxidase [Sedimentitalea sp.]
MENKSQLARLGLFDAKVPRYTSYPTAPHFNDTVGPQHMVDWIEKISPGSQISLYVHVPFCRRLCWFCACRTQGTFSGAPLAGYLRTLKAELDMLARHLPRNVTLSRLHWGGGTPTMLDAAMIEDLAGAIRDVAPLAPNAEFSVEIDPNEIDAPRLNALANAGMTRASIGVQDFDPEIQSAIGRLQSYDVTRDVVDMIRANGITSLNTDILFGLPHQSRRRMTQSVQKVLSLNPDRVAVYGYAHVPWMARRQTMISAETLPSPEQRLSLFETARRLFLWDGYQEIGIDHFARAHDGLAKARDNGHLRRNFQGYTDDPADVLIGTGASSISRFPQGYTQNAASTSAYAGHIRDARFSVTRGHIFSATDRLRARMIETLMCQFHIDPAAISAELQVPRARVDALLGHAARAFPGQLILKKEGLSVPKTARPLTRMIAQQLDAYALDKAVHSSAI